MKSLKVISSVGITAAVIALLLVAGCSSLQTGLPVPATATYSQQRSDFAGYVLGPDELPTGFMVIAQAPLGEKDVDVIMKAYQWQEGYRVLYQSPGAKTTTEGIIEQYIVRFPAGNASAVIGAYESYFQNLTPSGKIIILPDPGIGDRSSAVKITTGNGGDAQYNIEFAKSDLYELFTFTGSPDEYQNLVKVAEQAETKIG
jgi:hypothetical protein